MRGFRRNVIWTSIGGGICLFGLIFLVVQQHQQRFATLVSPSDKIAASPSDLHRPQDVDLAQSPVTKSKRFEPRKSPISASPSRDQAAIEAHREMAAALDRQVREVTRRLYRAIFQRLGLSVTVQDAVIEILAQPQKELEQSAFEAAQSGNIPVLPSLEELRARQLQQNQQLRTMLGDAGFAQFTQYQATIPDRIVIDAIDQQGGDLSENQSQQLLQILTQARQEIMSQSTNAQSFVSMPPEQAAAMIQQQQLLLEQTVDSRVQAILTPDQRSRLRTVLSRFGRIPNAP